MFAAKKLLGATAAGAAPIYVEDVFSTYLWAGNGSTQTITNGIDLSGEGGMVWMKNRSTTYDHGLFDTLRGVGKGLRSNLASAEFDLPSTTLTAFNSNGFSIGDNASFNNSGNNIVGWTFRKAEKFFDVVTYTGNGSNRTISHNLGSVPGCIIVKRTDTAASWRVYHRGLTDASYFLSLNLTDGQTSAGSIWNSTAPTSTVFSVGTSTTVNESGGTYVAYLFAHDAGGFGDAGDQSVVKCGSYTGNGSATGPTIDLGWEPQWVLIKQATDSGTRWTITDNMRGFPVASAGQQILQPHVTDAEVNVMYIQPTSTGFKVVDVDGDVNTSGKTYIYVAIRRGPMKTPEAGTEVFAVNFGSDTTTYTTNFPLDMGWDNQTTGNAANTIVGARLLGQNSLQTASTASETTIWIPSTFWQSNSTYRFNANGSDCATYAFRRAPGFFDVVCYTGTGSARTVSHNLGVAPELMIVRSRSNASNWEVYAAPLGATKYLRLDLTSAAGTYSDFWNDTAPTSSVFSVATDADVNGSGRTYVAYLFGSVTGVSKVGSYTGTGTTLQVNCGFTAGARFVLIKRTDSTGDWYVWDTARGIVSGNDPYLLLNSTAAEVTSTDYIDTYSAGFEISSTAPAAINANGGTFIYLAIA